MVGYNLVSKAKEVYRIRRGEDQPWPKYPSLSIYPFPPPSLFLPPPPCPSFFQFFFLTISINQDRFKKSVEEAFSLLEKVVHTSFELITESVGLSPKSILSLCGDPSPLPPNTFSSSPFDLFHYFNHSSTLPSSPPSISAISSSPLQQNTKINEKTAPSSSPNDITIPAVNNQNKRKLSIENNKNEKDKLENNEIPPNCFEHVDPGMLTCVPCTQIPGSLSPPLLPFPRFPRFPPLPLPLPRTFFDFLEINTYVEFSHIFQGWR